MVVSPVLEMVAVFSVDVNLLIMKLLIIPTEELLEAVAFSVALVDVVMVVLTVPVVIVAGPSVGVPLVSEATIGLESSIPLSVEATTLLIGLPGWVDPSDCDSCEGVSVTGASSSSIDDLHTGAVSLPASDPLPSTPLAFPKV